MPASLDTQGAPGRGSDGCAHLARDGFWEKGGEEWVQRELLGSSGAKGNEDTEQVLWRHGVQRGLFLQGERH